MVYLLVYDINEKRLQRVAKVCVKYGSRVQGSVFEMRLNNTEYTQLKRELSEIINVEEDSVRIYKLRKWNDSDLEIIGKEETIELTKSGDIFL